MTPEQLREEARQRYVGATELVEQTRHEWEEAGRPLMVEWPNGVVSEAPLLKLLRETERDAQRFAAALEPKKSPGRKPVAVVTAKVGGSPAADRRKLRAVS